MLILAATPIGNLEDGSPRLKRVLEEADRVFAEDTRHSRKLLQHWGIGRGLEAFHEHSDGRAVGHVRACLQRGETIVYISDAGMPGISDPGYELVRMAYELGVEVDVIPGPSAVINALVLSGLPSHQFSFLGFFPVKEEARIKMLARLAELAMTTLFFESPNRIREVLTLVDQTYPNLQVALCRELTKRHQEVLRGTAAEVLSAMAMDKGEMVLVFAPVEEEPQDFDLESRYRALLEEGHSPSQSVKQLAKSLRVSKRELYKQLGLKD